MLSVVFSEAEVLLYLSGMTYEIILVLWEIIDFEFSLLQLLCRVFICLRAVCMSSGRAADHNHLCVSLPVNILHQFIHLSSACLDFHGCCEEIFVLVKRCSAPLCRKIRTVQVIDFISLIKK